MAHRPRGRAGVPRTGSRAAGRVARRRAIAVLASSAMLMLASCATDDAGSSGSSSTTADATRVPGTATTGTVTVPGTNPADATRQERSWSEYATGPRRDASHHLFSVPVSVPKLAQAACPVTIGAPRLHDTPWAGLFNLPREARRLHVGAPEGSVARFVQVADLIMLIDDAGSIRNTLEVPPGCEAQLVGLDGDNPVVRTCTTVAEPPKEVAHANCAVVGIDAGSSLARWVVPVASNPELLVFREGRLLKWDGTTPGQIEPTTGKGEIYLAKPGACDTIGSVTFSARAPMFTFECALMPTEEGPDPMGVMNARGSIDARTGVPPKPGEPPTDLAAPTAAPTPPDLVQRLAGEAGTPQVVRVIRDELRPDGRWIQMVDPVAFSRFPGGPESSGALFRLDPATTRTIERWATSAGGAYRVTNAPGLTLSDGPAGTVLVAGRDAVGLLSTP